MGPIISTSLRSAAHQPIGAIQQSDHDTQRVSDRLSVSGNAPLPKYVPGKTRAPGWLNKIRVGLERERVLVRGEINQFADDEKQNAIMWIAKKAHHQFRQDDPRYRTLEGTRKVIAARVESGEPTERVFGAGVRYTNLIGKKKFKPLSSVSLTTYDEPKKHIEQFGPNWGADFLTRNAYQGRGLASGLIDDYLKPVTAPVDGFKLYSEPHNAGWYRFLGLHQIGQTQIPNQDDSDGMIDITIFSSVKPGTEANPVAEQATDRGNCLSK